MFYDDVFQTITETGAFSEEAKVIVDTQEYVLKGIFCSGSYGTKEFDKGYSAKKTEKRQSFKLSLQSLPSAISQADLIRKTLTIRGRNFIVREVTGNDSGILNLDLVPGESNA